MSASDEGDTIPVHREPARSRSPGVRPGRLPGTKEAMRPRRRTAGWAGPALMLVAIAADPLAADEQLPTFDILPRSGDVHAQAGEAVAGELAVAPIPFSNPAVGPGLAVAAAYLHPWPGQPAATPPSVAGIGAFASVNGSWGVAGGQQIVLARDALRLSWGIGTGQVNLDFYGVGEEAGEAGRSLPFEQRFAAGFVEGLGRIVGPFYSGLRVIGARIEIRPGEGLGGALPGIDDAELTRGQVGVAIPLQVDSRDNRFWPTRGSFGEIVGTAYDPAVGSDVDYRALSLAWNGFLGVTVGQVLALRVAMREASEGAPFYALPSFGSQSDLRGYTPGRYRDAVLAACQAEYRWRPLESLAFVGFAGVGDVAAGLDELGEGGLLPAAGIGARWLMAPKNGLGLRFDVAIGRDEVLWYLALGEAF